MIAGSRTDGTNSIPRPGESVSDGSSLARAGPSAPPLAPPDVSRPRHPPVAARHAVRRRPMGRGPLRRHRLGAPGRLPADAPVAGGVRPAGAEPRLDEP